MKDRETHRSAAIEESVQVVTFRVGNEEYGLDINAITEVVRPLHVTALPKMPAFVEGVINLRGTIIPVVDLRSRFELPRVTAQTRKMRMLITRGAAATAGGKQQALLGLAVDSVNEVIDIPKKAIDPAPEAATGGTVDFIIGMGKVRDRLIILLDIGKILNQQERTALAEAGNAG